MAHQYTTHAYERVIQRSSENPDHFLSELDNDRFILLGREVVEHKEHDLVYSGYDGEWFVIVRDTETEEVVTFLPIDYHHRWVISQQALDQAYAIVTKSSQLNGVEENGQKNVAVKQRSLRLSAVTDLGKGRTRAKGIGSWPINSHMSLSDFTPDEEFWEECARRCEAKEVTFSKVETVVLKLKNMNDDIRLIYNPMYDPCM